MSNLSELAAARTLSLQPNVNVIEYLTAGTFYLTLPVNVYQFWVDGCAGGGGGGGPTGAAGGGGGSYITATGAGGVGAGGGGGGSSGCITMAGNATYGYFFGLHTNGNGSTGGAGGARPTAGTSVSTDRGAGGGGGGRTKNGAKGSDGVLRIYYAANLAQTQMYNL